MKIMICAHGHPELSPGGSEVAAYALFQQLQHAGHTVHFVAICRPEDVGHDAPFGLFRSRPNEILWRKNSINEFRISSNKFDRATAEFDELLEMVKPDVVHFHHYFGFSTDVIRYCARELGVPTLLTIHEFGAICVNFGQMMQSSGALCYASSPTECFKCNSSFSVGQHFLRKERLLDQLADVSAFISPSAFLAGRYAEWGLPEAKLHVIENIARQELVDAGSVTPEPVVTHDDAVNFGYFGQITPFKGVSVYLKAIGLIPEDLRKKAVFHLYGTTNGPANAAHYESLADDVEACGDSLRLHGAYRNTDAVALMQGVDWIVLPSIWWENSPVVIEEAKVARTPILASNIGGMREKVTPGVNGAQFVAGDAGSLAQAMIRVLQGALECEPPPYLIADANSERLNRIMSLYEQAITPAAA